MPLPDSASLLDRLAAIVGARHVVAPGDDALTPYTAEMRGRFEGRPLGLVRPATTEEVAAVMRLCAETGTAVIPQGGNTGLAGGTVALAERPAILLNLGRMNRIRSLDAADFTVTAEAGCILADLQQAAAAADRLFPLSLGAEGSCTIGGNLSTNAGGVMTIRYGNMRDLVLGIEAVLPDGRVWNGLRRLRKNNTGYDLKHLFIAGEGTLGVVTAAVLKLFPKPAVRETALVGLADLDSALTLFGRLRAETGDSLFAFEVLPRFGLDLAVKHIPDAPDPLPDRHDWYVLIDLHAGGALDLRGLVEAALGRALEDGLIADAVLAESEDQRARLWRVREAMAEAPRHEGGSIHHDVSVPVSRVAAFVAAAESALHARAPGIRTMPFGHLGDGNIHYTLLYPEGSDPDAFRARWSEFNAIVHQAARDQDGSISAEHGIGLAKRDELSATADPVELDLMRAIKRALDPDGRMNPGKMLEF